jgi:hypothetical protein
VLNQRSTVGEHEIVGRAGPGHCNAGSSADLLVVAAYPNGTSWDTRRGDPAERDEVLANIEAVPLPDTDPVHGPNGALIDIWRTAMLTAHPGQSLKAACYKPRACRALRAAPSRCFVSRTPR